MGCGCDCGTEHGTEQRAFFTKEEKLKSLKEYQDSLEKEMQGVKERIKELSK